jgi:diadenosine tetraphosphate (Ap4A) HIT family hydrolase
MNLFEIRRNSYKQLSVMIHKIIMRLRSEVFFEPLHGTLNSVKQNADQEEHRLCRQLKTCPVCTAELGRVLLESEHAAALSEAQPLVAGHTVIVPRKHVGTMYELTPLEHQAIWELVGQVRERLLTSLKPSGFSIGFSDTMEGGDIVDHACIHVVPRRRGDNLELPSGIGWVTDDHVVAWKQ